MRRAEMQQHLLAAAEEILRTEGPGGFSVRGVTAAAGVNVAAVTTAFGGRGALIEALFSRAMEPVNEERRRLYLRLGDAPGVEAILRAFLVPLASVDPGDGSATSALLRVIVSDSDGGTSPVDRLVRDPGTGPLDELLASALPRLSAEERALRIRFAVGTVLSLTAWSGTPVLVTGAALDGLLAFISAGVAHGGR